MFTDICARLLLNSYDVGDLVLKAGATPPAEGAIGYVRGTGQRALIALASRDGRLLIIMEGECGSIARIIDAHDIYPTEREARFCGRPPSLTRSPRLPHWQPAAEVAA